jgi:hypothetical protein
LLDIYEDINKGLVPDAKPAQLLEVEVWKGKNYWE